MKIILGLSFCGITLLGLVDADTRQSHYHLRRSLPEDPLCPYCSCPPEAASLDGNMFVQDDIFIKLRFLSKEVIDLAKITVPADNFPVCSYDSLDMATISFQDLQMVFSRPVTNLILYISGLPKDSVPLFDNEYTVPGAVPGQGLGNRRLSSTNIVMGRFLYSDSDSGKEYSPDPVSAYYFEGPLGSLTMMKPSEPTTKGTPWINIIEPSESTTKGTPWININIGFLILDSE